MEWLRIPTSTELVRVRTDEIVGVVANGNYSILHLYDGRQLTMTFKIKKFEEAFDQLHYNPFVRIGRSLIINMQYIYRINLIERRCYLAGQPLKGEFKFEAPRMALEALKQYMEKPNVDEKPQWQDVWPDNEQDEQGKEGGNL